MHWKNRKQTTRLMTGSEQTDLLVVPRLHLQAILDAHFELEHLYSVAGVFNIAAALANYRHRRELEAAFDQGQLVMAALIGDARGPTADEASVLVQAFNAADRYIRVQQKPDLARACQYVERRIAAGDAFKPAARKGASE